MTRALLISGCVAAAILLSPGLPCASAARKAGATAPQPPVGAERCPVCRQSLTAVPIRIGLPTTEMVRQLRLGHALLGGCVGGPGKQQATVCLKCRKWIQPGMKHWQPLPKEFGKDAHAGGRS